MGDYTFWLGIDAEEFGRVPGSRADASSPQAVSTKGFDPARFWAVVEKHAAVVRLDLLCDLVNALGLRLRVKVIDQ